MRDAEGLDGGARYAWPEKMRAAQRWRYSLQEGGQWTRVDAFLVVRTLKLIRFLDSLTPLPSLHLMLCVAFSNLRDAVVGQHVRDAGAVRVNSCTA